MRANPAALCIVTLLWLGSGAMSSAQTEQSPSAETTYAGKPAYSAVYCSGFVRDNKVPEDLYIISGEASSSKIIFTQPDLVYINEGSEKGVNVGDRFLVVRREVDPAKSEWFKGQFKLRDNMGLLYRDLGQLRVVNVQPKVSVAQVVFSCASMERGDLVRPFEPRPTPPLKTGPFEHFAPVSGKPSGQIVAAVDYAQTPAQNYTMYVNLGAANGLKVGDYVRIFRYQGELIETVPVTKNSQNEVTGFGRSPVHYEPKDLPREVLGEGVVLNASRNAATVMVTFVSAEVFAGDHVEIE